MTKLFVAAALAAAFVVAPLSAAAPQDVWKKLHRPLHLPLIDAGAPCPVSPKSHVDLGAEGVELLPGPGPAYPNLGGTGMTLEFQWPPQGEFYGTGWSGNKVLWWVAGTYHGPVLIRGRQLDGKERLRFERGSPPPLELRILAGAGYAPWKGARDRPSYTRVRAEGCYGYQIDGTTFSRVIVFQAHRMS